MAQDYHERQPNRESARIEHKPPEFQQAPGESEADAVREAFAKNAGVQPEQVAGALSTADATTHANTLSRLQAERGNAFVQRVVAAMRSASEDLPCGQDSCVQRHSSGTHDPAQCGGCPHKRDH